jgi:Tol biopolymer transport system component
MTPERWQQVKEIFHAALEQAPDERPGFLARACGEDETLRKEVKSLIAAHEKDGSFIDSPAYEAAAGLVDERSELKTGETIGSYEIISFISRGGMGEVYLAQDRRLGRKIALKLLPSSLTKDPNPLRRFEQEARAASALNHPNIITIYEIREANSTLMIATEFVEGETLRQRLGAGLLELGESLHIAIQIADALAAAHKVGIVHRDIKPENIMLRPDGYVKVLDFGLAKLTDPISALSAAEAPTKKVKTGSGMIMGTVGYMSPEQARGQTIDARSDIFNLGAVIYEMVTGHKPFDGETPSDMLAAILKTEPPLLSHFTPEAPSELVRIVTKALRKDREQRYQVVKDLLLDLKSLREELDFQAKLDRSVAPSTSGEAKAAVGQLQRLALENAPATSEIRTAVSTITHSLSVEIKRHKIGAIVTVAALMLALIAGIVATYKFLNRSVPATQSHLPQVLGTTQLTFAPGLASDPSLSPDGNSVVYSSDQSGSFEVYLKQLTPGGREIPLTSDGQQNVQPAWSPDGQRILFYSKNRGGIWVVPALGGTPRQLTDFGSWPSWSRDGGLIAFQSGAENALPPSTIWTVPSGGGTPRQITQVGNPPGGHGAPSWSPDGKRIVFTSNDYLTASVWSISVNGDQLRQVVAAVAADASPVFSPDGGSVYYSGYGGPRAPNLGIWKVGLSSNGDSAGDPELIMAFPGSFLSHFSVSADGKKLAYAPLDILSTLTSLPMSVGSHEPAGPPAPLSKDRSQRHVAPSFSPDGRRIAFAQWRQGTGADLWLIDADGKNLTQLTSNPAVDNVPSWFPKGDRLQFISNRNGYFAPWSINLTSGKEDFLADLGSSLGGYARMSPDGKQIAFNSTASGTINVWVAPVESGHPEQLTFDKEMIGFPCWSPDGKLIAFEMKRGADQYLGIVPSEGGTPVLLVSDHGLSWPHDWSPDGEKVVFAGQRNGVWNIYWVSRTSKEQKQLTHYSKLNLFVRYPAWSPRDNQIVYEYAETTGNIWLMELK